MSSRHRQPLLLGAVAVATAALVAACGSATSGHGTGDGSPTSGTRPPDFPSSGAAGTSVVATSSTGTQAPPTSSTETGRPLTVTGSSSGKTYAATIWGSDTITDCAAHAYGAKMIAFLRRHPCRSAHRVLATLPLDGRTVAISSINTSIPGTAKDPYVYAAQFKRLELADSTGSVNDLLREGTRVPGVSGGIPFREAFTVLGQDTGVTIFDAWYVGVPTKDQDPALMDLESDLYFSNLMTA